MPGGNHWVYWFSQTRTVSTNFLWSLFVKRKALREGNLYVVNSNDSVSWVGKVRVSTLDRLEKDYFSVSDTGGSEEKIRVRPIGVEPPWGHSGIKVTGILVVSLLGCKLQILVSLRVFGMESHYIGPFRYRLVLCIKKFTKKHPDTYDHTEICFRGQFKLEQHPYWSPLGV